MARTFAPGSTVPDRRLDPVTGTPVDIPDPQRLIHLQFRRFAGCPICHLHLRSIVRRHAEIEAAGIREVVVFHSPADELREHSAGLPFALIADPGLRLYREFGVESSPRALLHPRAWLPVLSAVLRSTWGMLRGRERPPAARQPHGRLGLPADFLVAPDGRVIASRYGEHAYDQWSVDELLTLAAPYPPSAQSRPRPAS
ncbi:peroxiredoxin-like family protein [Micromonospora matsumotoense]|uniref:peroxiredoxin-like family protein n=1 Tax=Micromonospora matsumotoense TaxID=121616 RepID=UPI003D930805